MLDTKRLTLKNDILRGVYENNLRIIGKKNGEIETGRKERFRLKKRILFLLIVMSLSFSFIDSLNHLTAMEKRSDLNYSKNIVLKDGERLASIDNYSIAVEKRSDLGYSKNIALRDSKRFASIDNYNAFLAEPKVLLTRIFDLKVKTIVIDAGHGGADPGAIGKSGIKEKDITLDIVKRLKYKLKKRGNYNVLMTREKDMKLSLKDRIEFANSNIADLFISIHVNYLPNKPLNVIETFYFGLHSDEETLKRAELENKGSPYRIGNFNEIIQKISNTMKTQESKLLAISIQKSLFGNIRRQNRNVLDNGIKTAPFVVLLGVNVPSVLAEISCLSNKEEEEKLKTGEYREKIARYLEEGIVNYLNKKNIRRYEL